MTNRETKGTTPATPSTAAWRPSMPRGQQQRGAQQALHTFLGHQEIERNLIQIGRDLIVARVAISLLKMSLLSRLRRFRLGPPPGQRHLDVKGKVIGGALVLVEGVAFRR